jgi:nucleoside 2-deoxyribosyltransferase
MQPRLYIAGPEVFLLNAAKNAENQKELCRQYGFVPLHPMDNNLDLGDGDMKTAMRIYGGDIGQIRQCDIVVANCNGFRGVCMDDGTAYELGFGNALGKPSYGHILEKMSLVSRTIRDYPYSTTPDGRSVDTEGYLVTDDFGTSINLMMQCGMMFLGGRLVEGDFEACLKALRSDLDSDKLVL